eukprot:105710-Rhodomonas_salina.1
MAEEVAPVSETQSRRSSAGSTGRRSSTGSKTPAKEVEADDETEAWAAEAFSAVAPKTAEKVAKRRSSTGSKTPAPVEEEAPVSEAKSKRRSST